MRRVLEASSVEQQNFLRLFIKAPHRAEVAIACLLECLPSEVEYLQESFDLRGCLNRSVEQIEVRVVHE